MIIQIVYTSSEKFYKIDEAALRDLMKEPDLAERLKKLNSQMTPVTVHSDDEADVSLVLDDQDRQTCWDELEEQLS